MAKKRPDGDGTPDKTKKRNLKWNGGLAGGPKLDRVMVRKLVGGTVEG